jgi:hypothetical protein
MNGARLSQTEWDNADMPHLLQGTAADVSIL